MRRYRPGGGATGSAKANASPVPDPISLIRAFDSDSNPTRPMRPSPLTTSTIHGLPLELLDRLRSFPLFLSAPDSFLAAIGTHLRPQLYQPHDYILTEGDDAKAMYWLVRGAVRVTSRDGESTYAELKPGAFFGEIGILMEIPRTATIVAKMKSLVVRLNKEDLFKELPGYPAVEQTIRDEAKERLSILERKKKEIGQSKPLLHQLDTGNAARHGKRTRDRMDGDVIMGDEGAFRDGEIFSNKKRKSPSPGLAEAAASSALGSGSLNIRQLLRELPLFSSLPAEILHFLGLRAEPRNFTPFTEIIQQGSKGRDAYFIVRGEVEVLKGPPNQPAENGGGASSREVDKTQEVKARLRPGQYFGEVTTLSLAPRRTATVRSVTAVECLIIPGEVLDELWEKVSPDIRNQVESTARQRIGTPVRDEDVAMTDAGEGTPPINELAIADLSPRTPKQQTLPLVTFSDSTPGSPVTPSRKDEGLVEPYDPDPYLNPDLDNMRSRSRRGSLAPPSPAQTPDGVQPALPDPLKAVTNGQVLSPSPLGPKPDVKLTRSLSRKRPKFVRRPSSSGKGTLPENALVKVLRCFDLHELMKMRLVSMHWLRLITQSPELLHMLDLTKYNRRVTDEVLANIICPFVGNRPRMIDISNCFHVSDEGFVVLASNCGSNVRTWRMKSVWDITGQAVLEMVNRAKGLEDVDLSNCRKVGDNLLARVVGWVVPDIPTQALQHQQHQQQQQNGMHRGHRSGQHHQQTHQPVPPGTVVGCPKLRRLTLSYCKHITDRSMAHIAVHAASRLEQIDLTRCTTITDQGFQHWSVYPFPRLNKLCLADCTYLTDHAIVCLTNAAKGLRELDLSFCCALSDTATEVLSLGCPNLTHLNLAFCGSAVSDSSLRSIGLHLLELCELSVRGCVRVTGIGVEAVVDGCNRLEMFDVSQCKNLQRWLDSGGVERVEARGRNIRFETVADGRWRSGET